jgi:hypothetical protein
VPQTVNNAREHRILSLVFFRSRAGNRFSKDIDSMTICLARLADDLQNG